MNGVAMELGIQHQTGLRAHQDILIITAGRRSQAYVSHEAAFEHWAADGVHLLRVSVLCLELRGGSVITDGLCSEYRRPIKNESSAEPPIGIVLATVDQSGA